MNYPKLVEFCGEDAANSLNYRIDIEKQIKGLEQEQQLLEVELKNSFSVELSITDILVASISGIVCGAMNGLFKSHVPTEGKLKHSHSTKKSAVDYKVPTPDGLGKSAQSIHRQIGPGHDLGRFKEALDLMSGKKTDFPLWGKSITAFTGGIMLPGNQSVISFTGFNIPDNPKAELMNHLLIDFFTKTSLPLPYSSYISDLSPILAKFMLGMYDSGLNLKNVVSNTVSIAILQLIIHSYAYLYKSAKEVNLYERLIKTTSLQELNILLHDLNVSNKIYVKSKEFDTLQAIAHGSSFLIDSIITTTSKTYAGLFCLDYGTLICFTSDVIKYLKKGIADYQNTFEKMSNLFNEKLELESAWYNSFKKDFLTIATDAHFQDTFNPEQIIANHHNIMQHLDKGQDIRNQMLKELKDWKI